MKKVDENQSEESDTKPRRRLRTRAESDAELAELRSRPTQLPKISRPRELLKEEKNIAMKIAAKVTQLGDEYEKDRRAVVAGPQANISAELRELLQSVPEERRQLRHLRARAEAAEEREAHIDAIREQQKTGGKEAYLHNVLARSTATKNSAAIARAAKGGKKKKETAKALGLNIKTVRKHWPNK